MIRKQGDAAVQNGNTEEAIVAYERAHDAFPLRQDIVRDLEGARLIFQSDLDYGQIYDIKSDIQEQPPVSQLPQAIQLKPNELYVPILMYHHIRINPKPGDPVWAALNVTAEQLDAQLQFLSTNNFHTITLDDLNGALNGKETLPENPIILTFDDGYRTFYDNAFPLLKKYNMKATEFVITQAVDASAYLTWDQILEIDKSDLVQFEAHSRHHPNLPSLSQASIIDEIRGSKEDLESHLKKPANWFAYPYGSYNDFVVKTVRDANYTGAVSTIYGSVQSSNNLFLLNRIMVDGRYSVNDLEKRIKR
ncbi:MAG TPA: polysaccharide deacetylase family protein [Candidatus Saccharimonadales bacterium]|nr:polysaccharide deacetylase family protein [Candidatus Saccharimonadales bacterium]